ncbi:MAG: hypothetical protein HZA51_06475 [Planctomycetes bacterium]|nr:hypothetical protein [Planctomycetota bacterium]
MSPLDKAIAFCGSFEAELLVELMMRHWAHPNCDDREVRDQLVEGAAEVLQRSKLGEQLVEGLAPGDMNFVAAVWCFEHSQIVDSLAESVGERRDWLSKIRRAIPSCFCDPHDLA